MTGRIPSSNHRPSGNTTALHDAFSETDITTPPEEDRATGIKIWVKIGRELPEICSRTDRQTDRQTQSSQYSAPLSERSNYRLLKLIRSSSVLSDTVGHRHMQLHSQPKRTYDTYVMHAYDIYFNVHTLYKK